MREGCILIRNFCTLPCCPCRCLLPSQKNPKALLANGINSFRKLRLVKLKRQTNWRKATSYLTRVTHTRFALFWISFFLFHLELAIYFSFDLVCFSFVLPCMCVVYVCAIFTVHECICVFFLLVFFFSFFFIFIWKHAGYFLVADNDDHLSEQDQTVVRFLVTVIVVVVVPANPERVLLASSLPRLSPFSCVSNC